VPGLAGIVSFAWKILRGASVASTASVTVGADFGVAEDLREDFCVSAERTRELSKQKQIVIRLIKSIFIRIYREISQSEFGVEIEYA
jgi:hypothetical protein